MSENHTLARRQPQDSTQVQVAQVKGNLLFPTQMVQQLGDCLQARISIVKLSPRPDDGDVYTGANFLKGGKVALSKAGLLKLADAAGIKWVTDKCRLLTDPANREHCIYEVVGYVRGPDGTARPFKASKELDLSNDGPEAQLLRDKGKSEREVASELARMRQHRLSMVETKAYNRAIRAALKIKQAYSPKELEEPFLVPHIDFVPDYSDPETRRIALVAQANESAAIYGGTMQQYLPAGVSPDVAAPVVAALPSVSEPVMGEPLEPGPDSEEDEETLDGEAVEHQPGGADEIDPAEGMVLDFQEAIAQAQTIGQLNDLAKQAQSVRGQLSPEQWKRVDATWRERKHQLLLGGAQS